MSCQLVQIIKRLTENSNTVREQRPDGQMDFLIRLVDHSADED